MKLLNLELDRSFGRRIWASEATIVGKYNEPMSVMLAVDNTIHDPGDPYLGQRSKPFDHDYYDRRCVGVVEATDQELEILAGAGYRLTDLRNVGVSELLKALEVL